MNDIQGLLPSPVYRSAPLPSPRDARIATVVEVVVSWGDAGPLVGAHLRAGERFVLVAKGRTDPSAHAFVHPAMEAGEHVLVEHLGSVGRVTPPMDARAVVAYPAATDVGAGSFVLPREASAFIEHGEMRYVVRHVPVAARLPARRIDRLFGLVTVLALGFAIAAGRWARGLDVDDRLVRDDEDPGRRSGEERVRWVAAMAHAPTHPEPDGGPEGGTGLRAAGDEGSSGSTHAPRASRRWSTPPRRGPARDETTANDARAFVARRGIFAALGAVGGASAPMLPGVDDDAHATGTMYGTAVGDARGYAGIGLVGTGWGGGGSGEGLVGLGRMRTRGHGTDDGSGQGIGQGGACGCGDGNFGTFGHSIGVRVSVASPPRTCSERRADGTATEGCGASVRASMDSAAIRRVVLRNLGQVRRCYETALRDVPDAHGRVTIHWVTAVDGRVLSARTMDDSTGAAAVGPCIADAVRRWQFPAFDEVVTVNYPFDLDVTDR